MSDLAAVWLALAVWLGALVAAPVPLSVAATIAGLGFVLRRPLLVVLGGFGLAAALSALSWQGLAAPAPATVTGRATLVSDPVAVGHSVRADVRIDGRRLEAWASGAVAADLRDAMAGHVIGIRGRVRAPPDGARVRLAVRHVAGRVELDGVVAIDAGAPLGRLANATREILARGAAPLADDRRALFTGLLIGDDRAVPPVVEADFRAAGMTHLLAVSGSNVALVLAVAGPVLRRLELRGRLVASLALIGFFAVVTRAEPSVLRASAMASIACWTAFVGRPTSRVRVLALAVAALVLVDPMLPRSVGFQLSVGASLGLALFAAPIARRLPGPRWIAELVSVTVAAQVGVLPVAATAFGGVPLVSLVANVLAVPVAGPLTAWGLTAGFAAGVFGAPLDAVVHQPTALLLGWIEGVARFAASLPLGLVGVHALVLAAAAATLTRLVGGRRAPFTVPLAVLVVLVVAARMPAGPLAGAGVARGAALWRDGAVVVVVEGAPDGGRLLEGLRRAGIRRIDLLVAASGTRTTAATVAVVRARIPVRAIAAPAGHRIRDATAITRPTRLTAGRLRIGLLPSGDRLRAHILTTGAT